ncbi:MAG TPA: substrate-binding domain-containing protein, partial [Candidatus Hydrogenedentes bacterium]|nr:substrate-binding domain-containing protein [Candidatus Hydrogenedentota bacterium]
IPEDVEIATSDDDEFAARRGIPMLLATQPGTEIGRAAAGLLMRRVGAPGSPPESLVLPPVGGVTAYQPR